MDTEIAEKYMQRCLDLAKKGIPFAMPNPSVGAVLVYENRIIGEGFTSPFGGKHAEVNCIESVKDNDVDFISKSTLYVSLEPCSFVGKTPACSSLIVQNKISQIVIGCVDTFSKVSGNGIKMLLENGSNVEMGILEDECRELNKRFFTFHEKKRPFVILKWAETKDKFIAPEPNLHKKERWITDEFTKVLVHKMRSEEAGILVGKNTVLKDNSSLTVREFRGENSIRILLDSKLELYSEKEKYVIFNTDTETIVFNSVTDFEENNIKGIKMNFEYHQVKPILDALFQLNIQSILVEGGAEVLQSFINQNLWDEAFVFQGNKVFKKGIKAPVFENKNLKSEKKLKEDRLFHYVNNSF